MPRRLLLLAVLATTLPLAAQDAPVTVTVTPKAAPDAKTSRPPAATGRITGTVLCADTHRPARGALLLVQPLPPDGSASDDISNGANGMARVGMDGTYTVEHLTKGEYSVVAILPGYVSAIDEMIADGIDDSSAANKRKMLARLGTVSVTGQETERYDITLQRGAALSGHVRFSDGSPATQVGLEIQDVHAKKLTSADQTQARMAAGIARTMFTHQNWNTDDQGNFRIAGVKPGTYRLSALTSFASNTDAEDQMGSVAVMFGGALDPGALRVYSGDTLHAKAAKTYELRSGDEVPGIDITIPLNAYHQVKGILTAVDGRPINKATLTLTDTTDDSVTFETSASEDGTYAFPAIAAGTYTLAAKEAKIIARQPGTDVNVPMRFAQTKPTNAFADGTTSVIVKDSDVPDTTLTLTEVPLPPQPTEPTPPNSEDQQ